ncbi:OLC1v1031328C2 [Oldenlandia corymbosa var. corymbosa]|nr:OLC1v1031328C2 [Oldenlandia corymbosa var. corymbosa]
MKSIRNFMAFDATQLLKNPPQVSPIDSELHSNQTLSIPLYDVNLFLKSNYKDYRTLMVSTLAKDAKRAAWMASFIEVNSSGIHQNFVELLVGFVEGVYATTLQVGTPPQTDVWIVDTGSNLIWWDCKPCKNCPANSFDPSKSSTFKQVNCGDSNDCPNRLGLKCSSSWFSRKCVFGVDYIDGTRAEGFMAHDRITTNGGTLIEDLKFGCSDAGPKQFTNHKFTGIMGFGRGALSFPSQYKATSFSYCLAPTFLSNPMFLNTLIFRSQTTLKLPLYLSWETSYSAQLVGITVGNQYAKANPNPPQDRYIRAVVDSGTRLTWLPPNLYYRFRNILRSSFSLPSTRHGRLDTCYKIGSRDITTLNIPAVTFIFLGSSGEPKQILSLNAEQIFVPVDNYHAGIYCLAFAPQEKEHSFALIGNVQLTGTRVTVDLQYKNMYLDVNKC